MTNPLIGLLWKTDSLLGAEDFNLLALQVIGTGQDILWLRAPDLLRDGRGCSHLKLFEEIEINDKKLLWTL